MSQPKQKTNSLLPIPTSHAYCDFKKKDDRILTVTFKTNLPDESQEIVAKMKQLCDDSLSAEKKGKQTIYYLSWSDLEGFLESLTDIEEGKDPECSEYSSSSTDDEMLHKALARRYRYKTSQPKKMLEEQDVSDSEMEDPISISRRLRHLYNIINSLQKRVADLESREK